MTKQNTGQRGDDAAVEALRKRVARAICDPGAITPRGDNYEEHLTDWQVRAVLAELRLSRVGTVSPDHDGYPKFSGVTPSTEDMNHERECPVYRLDTPSWDRSALVVSGRGDAR